jgi:hypothetical protein
MIDPVIADREWDANTDPSRWPYEKRERAAAGAESPDVDDVIVPLEAFSIFNDLDLGGAKGETVVLAVGSDIETAMLIPMTPQTARLVASKMLLKARDCGEDISRLFAR